MSLSLNLVALFLFVAGIILALTGETVVPAAIFVVGGWIIVAMSLAVDRLERR